jgi:hypothetical protein
VDFLHQFWQVVVPKEDKAPPCKRSSRRLRALTALAEVFPRSGQSAPGEKMRWI